MKTLKKLFLVFFAITSTCAFAQNTINEVISNWSMIIAIDQKFIYFFNVKSINPVTEETSNIEAEYGWGDNKKYTVTGQLFHRKNQPLELIFTNPAGNVVTATQAPDGKFDGHLTIKGTTIENRVILGKGKIFQNNSPYIFPPKKDVPAECSKFLGGWKATWTNSGLTYLWVVNVDSKCIARFQYSKSENPKGFQRGEIKGGVLQIPVGFGTNYFEFRDEQLYDRFEGSGIQDELAFQKVGISPEEQARMIAEQKELEKKDFVPLLSTVPVTCASFYGTWHGKWSQGGIPDQKLRVVDVTPECKVRYSYVNLNNPGRTFDSVDVRNGELTFICNKETNGTCTFTVKGDELWATYSNPGGGSNSGVFKKQQ